MTIKFTTNNKWGWKLVSRGNKTIFIFSFGGKYNDQIVIALDVDMVIAFACKVGLSLHSL